MLYSLTFLNKIKADGYILQNQEFIFHWPLFFIFK